MAALPARQAVPTGHVLIIDDDALTARIAARLLESNGYRVSQARNGSDGLDLARSVQPDVILLDIEMPGMDGIEACEAIRRTPGLERIPVMFFSSRAKERFITRGFQAGAQDYLEKPFTETELLARVANLTRLARYEDSLRESARNLRLRNETLSRELQTARKMQWSLLPASLSSHPALRCAVFYEPMVEVGGDLYDVSLAPNGWIRLLVADVSGHGVFATLLAAFFRMGYQVYSDREPGPARMLQAVHRELCRSLDAGAYVTSLVGWLDPETGRFRYASAGHVPALVRRAHGAGIERLPATGPMIGLFEDCPIRETEVRLAPEDSLILLTDGILEALGPNEEMFGLRRVEHLAQCHPLAGPAELLQHLRMDLERFQLQTLPEDDLTALVVEWRPEPAPSSGNCHLGNSDSRDLPDRRS